MKIRLGALVAPNVSGLKSEVMAGESPKVEAKKVSDKAGTTLQPAPNGDLTHQLDGKPMNTGIFRQKGC
jgi:hypothetical protein